ncbi:Response regulator [Congregibacter litoralis KT71]|uniref:Response regulator n=1 Tax=Congregibacter litoralis KT71 TaxID=314285 RepID=A4A4W0_9GAMM|nr:Response regulator [Congregibacter litoralis KT71]
MAEHDEPVVAEHCVRAGISHYFCKPFSAENVRELLGDVYEERGSSSRRNRKFMASPSLDQFGLIRGSSVPCVSCFDFLENLVRTDTTALIIGERGTGKELIAKTLHTVSARSQHAYLTLNCAALAENLIESELFGHEKGSFSGAQKRHLGFFERAHGGTLFLDEITEMSTELQAKLLRVLENG